MISFHNNSCSDPCRVDGKRAPISRIAIRMVRTRQQQQQQQQSSILFLGFDERRKVALVVDGKSPIVLVSLRAMVNNRRWWLWWRTWEDDTQRLQQTHIKLAPNKPYTPKSRTPIARPHTLRAHERERAHRVARRFGLGSAANLRHRLLGHIIFLLTHTFANFSFFFFFIFICTFSIDDF